LIFSFPAVPIVLTLCLCGALVAATAPETAAQNSASAALEFSVRAAPSTGRAEKVMRHPFYLLRASVKEIEAAARQEVDPPDFDAFVDELTVSPELKAWMKKQKTADLQGDKFLALLTPDAILDVPEFRDAYVTRNLIMVGLGFPKRKAKLTDREKNPEKWEESEKRYWEEVRSYATVHPESRQGMDDHLHEINADAEWRARLERHEQRVHQKFLQLLHARYLVARTETDYDGRARFADIPSGRYWLTTLDNDVRAGDVRLRWELPLQLEPGRTHYLELNNANAIYLSTQR
jgi:hypothetical protein